MVKDNKAQKIHCKLYKAGQGHKKKPEPFAADNNWETCTGTAEPNHRVKTSVENNLGRQY